MKLRRGFYDVFVQTCAINPSKKAILQYINGKYLILTYSELFGICEYISQNLQQLKCSKDIVGLLTDRNAIVPCAIAAVHKSCNTFMFLDHTSQITDSNFTSDIKFKIIISIQEENTSPPKLSEKRPDRTITIFNYIISFYNWESYCNLRFSRFLRECSFIASTSGSTGEKKHVQVPVQCIQPNIDDLTKLFNITSGDIIYFSTPLTFDPSMVEILLAFKNGASLLIAPEESDILFPVDKKYHITVWQTTPSKFFQFTNSDIKHKILSAQSSLKILALGGEPLNGVKRLRELKDFNNKTKLFTLYGVTEMSCWACVAELDLNKIKTDWEVPLGHCLSETQINIDTQNSINNTGKIVLVSNTRKCYVLNKPGTSEEECSLQYIDTGDIGEVNNGTIYYRGRKDDTVKRFGNKVNLQFIENSVMDCLEVKTCSCIWLPKLMLLVLYFSSETMSSLDLSKLIKSKLEEKYWPDKIIKVDHIPTNSHGKTSRLILTKMFENDSLTQENILPHQAFIEELTRLVNLKIDVMKDKTFASIGGTSFLSITICNKISRMYPQLGSLILPHLISNNKSIRDIIQIIQRDYSYEETKSKKRTSRPVSKTKRFANMQSISEIQEKSEMDIVFKELWKYDTGKCVDASPTLYSVKKKMFVTVSSHSGKIVVMDAATGVLEGEIKLNSRIEASTYCFDTKFKCQCGVVGSYDGTIVCFTLTNCEELWRINIRYMIKSKATYSKGFVYIASYDGAVRCIDSMKGDIKKTIQVADQPISADIVLSKVGLIMVGTLSGVCAGLDTRTKKVAWRGKVNSPIFARPALYDDEKYVIFAEVSGEIHCRTVETGIKVWKYEGAKGNVFSSLYIKDLETLKWQFVFGCHNNAVYSFTVKNFRPYTHWKTELSSPIYATPCYLNDTSIIATSTNGRMYVINSENGRILWEYQFPNETFSSPVVYDKKIYIGCRNDYLYCIKYSEDNKHDV